MRHVVMALVALALGSGCTRILLHVRSPDRAHVAEVIETRGAQVVRLDGKDGPSQRGVGIELLSFSPDGRHLAWPAQVSVGGGWRMMLDGAPGPAWDGIGDSAWSPDGARFAYAAERGGTWFVVDGARVGPPLTSVMRKSLLFSNDGQHLAYAAERDGATVVLRDGIAGTPWNGVASLRFSDDGLHLAYAARRDRSWQLVVDGTPSEPWEAIAEYALAPRARHVALIARRDHRWHLSVDGAPGPAWDSAAAVSWNHDGSRVAAVVREAKGQRVVEGLIAGSLYDAVDWRTLRFSPDGAHLAWVAQRHGRSFAVVDGREGPEFDALGPLVLAEKNGAWGYIGRRANRSVVVVGGREISVEESAENLVFRPDGTGPAWLATRRGHGLAVVDGKETHFDLVAGSTLVFSRDGRHWAVLAGDDRQRAFYVFIDGARRIPFDPAEPDGIPAPFSLASLDPFRAAESLRRAVAAELERALKNL